MGEITKKNGLSSASDMTGRAMETVESRMGSAAKIIVDIIVLLFRISLSIVAAGYRYIVPHPKKSVKGEIVLITGTGHGIGKELAKQYADLDATVICVDVNEATNQATKEEIIANGHKNVYAFQCDVSSETAIKDLADKIKNEIGTVSVLVNNAGIMPCKSILKYKSEEIRKLFDLNVFAHFWMLENFLPGMMKNNHGHIVTMSSMAGVIGVEYLVPYCATKFAVRGMIEALFEELRMNGSKIKFTVIYPYMVDTGLCQKPKIRFPSILGLLSPKDAARHIIDAMRKNIPEYSIPTPLLTVNNVCRLLPYHGALALKDFLGSSLDEHDAE